jgi:imidazolonepropionase-like amidohydrolase
VGSPALGSPEPIHWAVAGRSVITGAGEPVSKGVVVGRGESIVEIRSDGQIPRGAHVHYAGDGVILPGLIDCHVHLGGIHDPAEPSMMLSMLRASPELFTMWAARDARVTVEAGFTTVRECGARFVSAICAVRDAIQLGLCEGPRIVVGGWLSQTCGHLDRQMTGMVDRIESGLADGPEQIRRQVRQRLREGADFIKVCASNSPIADGHLPPLDEYSVEELRAAVEAAHAGGVKVACHAESERGILNALEAGVDTIEHGTFLTAEAAALMAERGTVLVPTLGVFPALVERLPRWLMKLSPEEAQGVLDRHLDSFQIARKAGVTVAMGSDTWRCLPHGENAAELEVLVRQGMSPMEAIRSATSVAAEALGLSRLGTLAPGKIGDVIVVDGNPLDDIGILRNTGKIVRVIRGGRCLVSREA